MLGKDNGYINKKLVGNQCCGKGWSLLFMPVPERGKRNKEILFIESIEVFSHHGKLDK